MRKVEVQVIQRALNRELGLSLSIDGVIGRETLLAVGAYQEKSGTTQDFCLTRELATELARAPSTERDGQ